MLIDIFKGTVIISMLSAMIRIATPILLAALGELISERAGIQNLGTEGAILIGAFTGFAVANSTGSLWLAAGLAMVAGGLSGLILAFMASTLKVDQIVTGLAINLFASGITFYLYRVFVFLPGTTATDMKIPTITIFETIKIPILSDIPFIGEILFSQHGITYIALIMVPVIWFFLYRTKYGLRLRALGDNPRAVDVKGLSVTKIQYFAVIFGGFMSGLGGAFLTLSSTGLYVPEMSAGRGWLAIVIVIAGNWRPTRILLAALVFSLLDAIQLQFQGLGIQIPYQILLALPYISAIVILAVSRTRSESPAQLAIPYFRE